MEISNLYDDLSITAVQEKAAPVGDLLRVAVTKTSAQGEAAQSATPNLMSFSTDENSIWFNGKKYGAYKLNYKLYELSGESLNQSDIINALDGFTQEHWDLVSEGGIGYMVSSSEGIASTVLCSLRAWVDSSHKYLSIVIYGVEGVMYLLFDYNNSSSTYGGTVVLDRSYIGRDEIVNNLTSIDTDKPLSAAMGKKLNDEKLAKTDVVNNFTTNDATKPLSAAKGKELYDTITSNRVTINFDTANNTTDNDTIKACLSNLDSTSLIKKLKNGAIIIDNSDGDWVITVQKLQDTEVIFAGITFRTVRVYIKTITVTISGSKYTNMAVITTNRYVPKVINSLTSPETASALSAAQGKVLNDKISALGSVFRIKGTKNNIADVFDISDSAQKGDVWNVIEAFTLDGKPYPAGTNVVCIQTWAEQSVDPNKNWDALGGTVNLSAYVPKSDIVNAVTSQDTNKPLSAAQGYKLQTEKFAKNDVKSSYDSSTSTVYSTQYINNREEDFEEDVRATVGPVYIPLNEKGTKTIQQQSITSDFTLVWLPDMKKIVAKSSSGSYYNNWKIENDLNPSNRDALLVVKDNTTNSPITGHIYILGDYSYRWDGSNFIQIDKTPLPTDYYCYINGLPRLANSTPSSLEEVFGSFANFKRGIESSKTIWVDTMYSGDIICSRRTLDNVTCAIFEGALTLRTSGTAEKDAYSGVYYIQCVIKYNSSGFLDGSTAKLYEDSIMPYYITDFPEKASNNGGRTDMDAFLGTLKDFEAAFKAGRPFRLLQSSETNTSSSNIIIVSKKSGAHSYYVQRIFATNLSDSKTCTKLHVINPTSNGGTKWEGYSILINTELVPLSRVVDSLDSTSLYPLSANQGKQLKSLIDKIKTGIIIE